MNDSNKKTTPETHGLEHEKPEAKTSQEERKAEITVGIETREAIEEAEIPTGEISEEEKRTQEGYAGGSGAGKAASGAQKAVPSLPGVKVMKKEVEKSLKDEMKDLRKKINNVMNKGGGLDAYQLNGLIAQLRRLQEILASLAHATGEFVKELWYKYVKKQII